MPLGEEGADEIELTTGVGGGWEVGRPPILFDESGGVFDGGIAG